MAVRKKGRFAETTNLRDWLQENISLQRERGPTREVGSRGSAAGMDKFTNMEVEHPANPTKEEPLPRSGSP